MCTSLVRAPSRETSRCLAALLTSRPLPRRPLRAVLSRPFTPLQSWHVVAGVDQPVVQAPNGQSIEGRVVYFDARDDLAVIATTGLTVPALDLNEPLAPGDESVVQGYPFGGPFVSGGAEVLAVSSERLRDIYGDSTSEREVYTLAAEINPGNSGGPLLALDGEVAGVVFAKSADSSQLGYAMTNTELAPVVDVAPELSAAVSSGSCIAE